MTNYQSAIKEGGREVGRRGWGEGLYARNFSCSCLAAGTFVLLKKKLSLKRGLSTTKSHAQVITSAGVTFILTHV